MHNLVRVSVLALTCIACLAAPEWNSAPRARGLIFVIAVCLFAIHNKCFTENTNSDQSCGIALIAGGIQ
jgi:hypothetical protein